MNGQFWGTYAVEMMNQSVYQDHLNRVSRSFAFCIEQLTGAYRHWVGLSYLLCRLLDTIEDSEWESPGQQESHFAEFRKFVLRPPDQGALSRWKNSFSTRVSSGERLLVNDCGALFKDLHDLPEQPRGHIEKSVLAMCDGMVRFHKAKVEGRIRLKSLNEVNEYCYVVAGVVGEMLTNLYHSVRPNFLLGPSTLLNSVSFGLFLQKVNLLKDQAKDEAEGRFFVHDRAEIFSSLREDARGALRYIQGLPQEDEGYRTFCGWSLFLGLASLSFPGGKVPRESLGPLLENIKGLARDNVRMERAFALALP